MPHTVSVIANVTRHGVTVLLLALGWLFTAAPAHAAGNFDAAASNSAALKVVMIVGAILVLLAIIFGTMAKKRGPTNNDTPPPDEPKPDE